MTRLINLRLCVSDASKLEITVKRDSSNSQPEAMLIGKLHAACRGSANREFQSALHVKNLADSADVIDDISFSLNGLPTVKVSVKLEECTPDECAKLAYESIQKVSRKLGDHVDDIDNLEMSATQIKDSGLPQSFVKSIPTLDAVVLAIDQVAEVSLSIN